VPVIGVDGEHAGVEAASTRPSRLRCWRSGFGPTCSCSPPMSTPCNGLGHAVCRFVETTGGRAAAVQLEAIPGLIAGTAGTQIDGRKPAVEYCG
jgi:hypothetical protein